MISTLPNERLPVPETTADHITITDGPLGGCGVGPVGDPNTFLPALWQAVIDKWEIRSVLDIGCGFGYSTRWFIENGLETLGLEGSRGIAKHAVTPAVHVHDFSNEKPVGLGEFDLCWCSEFLEHVEAKHEPQYFAAFVRCRFVAMSAALPGFGGHHHVNEQPSEYWIERFTAHGFRYDEEETLRLREIARATNPDSYFPLNGLFFVRESVVEPARVWTDIDGWLTKQQGEFLQTVVKGKTVLEIGSGFGRSTVCMAQVAKQVTTIDHHRGGTLPAFTANLQAFDVVSRVEPIVADIREIRDEIVKRRFHVVFVDGEHDAESVQHDTQAALECLLPGGVIVWHDYNYESVKEGIVATGIPADGVQDLDSVGILRTARNQVMVVMPHSGNVQPRAMKAAMRGAIGNVADQVGFLDFSYGCLEHNFNVLLSSCLSLRDQGKITHMAMLHSDIWADAGWVDLLSEEMCLHRSAVMSAVVTIKDPDDDRTSTAVGDVNDPWTIKRFIRLRDQPTMPVTFTEDDVCSEDGSEVLLINTGCMLIDLSHEFWDDCDGKGTPYAFHVESKIDREENKSRSPKFRPEDWNMSRDLNAANLPYGATWRVESHHVGVDDWKNRPEMRILSNG